MSELCESVKAAIIKGCNSLQWFEENHPETVTTEALEKMKVLEEVAFWGNAGVLRWMAEHRSEVVAPEKCGARDGIFMYWAAQSGNADVFAWLYEHSKFASSIDHVCKWVAVAASRGHLSVLDYMHVHEITCENSFRINYCYPLRSALTNGQIASANWMQNHGFATASDCKIAASTSVHYFPKEAVDWIFDRVPRSSFGFSATLWRKTLRRRQLCVLTLLLSGRRRGLPRLPPEIWEQCVQPLMCGGN